MINPRRTVHLFRGLPISRRAFKTWTPGCREFGSGGPKSTDGRRILNVCRRTEYSHGLERESSEQRIGGGLPHHVCFEAKGTTKASAAVRHVSSSACPPAAFSASSIKANSSTPAIESSNRPLGEVGKTVLCTSTFTGCK